MKQAREARLAAVGLGVKQGGVVSRRQLRQLGLGRHAAANEVLAGRWRVLGRAVIVIPGPLSEQGEWWAALANAGPAAVLDGVSALRASGLEGFQDRLTLSAPPGTRVTRGQGARIHVLRTYDAADVISWKSLRRTNPDVAAVRGALWVQSDAAARTVLAMTAQRRLATPAALAAAAQRLPRNKRKAVVLETVQEIAAGAMSAPEINFAKLCRRFGLPEPTRQVKRHRPDGVAYLDVRWASLGVVVEVDGIHHGDPRYVVADLLRHNDIALGGDIVLRIPASALRDDPEPFMAQVRRALVQAGWRPAA